MPKKKRATPKKTLTKKPAPAKKTQKSPPKKRGAKKPLIEKRQYLRLDYSRLISFTHYDTESLVEIPGKLAAVKDLSESGMLIETAELFEPGNILDLDIAFEQDKIVPAQGEVVHSFKAKKGLYNTGIKFLQIDWDDFVYLRKFVESHTQQED